ncbi:MAG: TIGR00730 family Rossman fold protein [Myxococcales bacterium]|nr:MAG: TIGR00730 family Rossman fold protein [Myxococcales bacterium]
MSEPGVTAPGEARPTEGRRVCVFCGAGAGHDPAFLEAARELGRGVAGRGWGLVYGGATSGLMGALADAALGAGGEVSGVIPASLVDRELAHQGLTRHSVVATLAERKARMFAEAHAFVALPGGFGTLDELFSVLTLMQIGELAGKTCVLLDLDGYYEGLLRFADHAVSSGLLLPRYRALLLRAASVDEALALLDPG